VGDYELMEQLGRGGMGVVWRARQVSLNRPVAVKMILAGQLATQAEVDRFRREAQAAAKLDHPNIVAVHEVGEYEGQQYFSMRLVEGRSLAAVAGTQTSAVLSGARGTAALCRDAATLLAKVARAVHHAHQRGILHRDLKPANILLDGQGEPHLTDFGLARLVELPSELSRSDAALGTPDYMSPEQAQGRRELTTATDIYSLGAVLFCLLTGRPPFQANTTWEILQAVAHQEPPRPGALNAHVDRDLETICLKCLDKDPQRRYGSAEAMADDLERWLRCEPILARRTRGFERAAKWVHRRPVVAALLGVTVLAVALGVAGVFWEWRSARSQLRASLLAQAHANRLTAVPGRRFHSLEILGQAAAIRPGQDLRDEAIACLAATDMRVVRKVTCPAGSTVSSLPDVALERHAVVLPDAAISLRRVGDGLELARLPSLGQPTDGAISLSRTGHWLAARYKDGCVRIWNLDTQAVVVTNRAREFPQSVAFGPDERLVAVADGEKEVRVFDTGTGRMVRSHESFARPEMLAFSPDGRQLAVALREGEVVVFETSSGKPISRLAHPVAITSLAWHSDNRRLATAGHDRHVRIWDGLAGRELHVLAGHGEEVHGVAFHPDGDLLLSGGFEGLMLWSVATGEQLLVLPGGRFEPMFSPGGDRFCVTTGPAGSFEIGELVCGSPVQTFGTKEPQLKHKAMAFSRDNHWLASTDGRAARWFDVRTGHELGQTHGSNYWDIQFSPTTNVWSTDLRGLAGFALAADAVSGGTLKPNGLVSAPCFQCSLTVSGDGLRLAAGELLHWRIRDANDGTELAAARIWPTARGSAASMDDDGRRLAARVVNEPEVAIWRHVPGVAALEKAATLRLPNALAVIPAFVSKGRRLAIHWGQQVAVYSSDDWRLLRTFPVAENIAVLAAMPRGGLLAVRAERCRIRLLDVETGELHATMEMPNGMAVESLAFSPDGSCLAAASASTRQIFVWNLAGIHRELAGLGLDWTDPPLPPAPPAPPASGPPRYRPAVDLARFYNVSLTNAAVGDAPENRMDGVEAKVRCLSFGGFDVAGRVQLRGGQALTNYPASVNDIPVDRACDRLHFLCAAIGNAVEGTRVGQFVMRLRGAESVTLPLVQGMNIADWHWLGRTAGAPGPQSAFRCFDAADRRLTLYYVAWLNPARGTVVESISFVSDLTAAAPFLIAITADE
jgi:WD40 repeat protein